MNKKAKRGTDNQFDIRTVCKQSKYKLRKLGVKVTNRQIKEVVNKWIEDLKKDVIAGKRVMIDKNSYIQVIGTPILKHKSAVKLISNGKYVTRSGYVKPADNMNFKRNDFVYGIKYENKNKLIFTPSKSFSKSVNHSLTNTNTYYHLNVN
jgi:hypothetical protein